MTQPSPRLWEKGEPLDDLVHRFTVGDDPRLDAQLVHWDCLGSAAHARTLARLGLLTDAELTALLAALAEIDALAAAGRFDITADHEDGHTAIEAFLIQRCGPAGEKIHTGRSRNDQVATALRLFLRHETLALFDAAAGFLDALLARAERDGAVPMPGYTHMQPAMPSSIGQWLHASAEATLEQLHAALDLLTRLDACPLGTGAGYGVPLPLDRQYTAELLGFSRPQRSPLDVQNSRGRLEKYFTRFAADLAAVLEKLACDLLLFSTAEFGFFSLPPGLTTGSSIMPQKHNPDVLELLRARGARLRACVIELEMLTARLPSGYHRDLQLTKEPALRAAADAAEMLAVAARVVTGFVIHPDRLAAAMRPELYAAHAALELAQAGTPFRAAYRQVADRLRHGPFSDAELARWRAAPTPDTDGLTAVREDARKVTDDMVTIRRRIDEACSSLLA